MIWFAFAVALENDTVFCLAALNLGRSSHTIYDIPYVVQPLYNLAIMLGSLFAPSYFLPQSKPKGVLSATTPA